ncbi:MAG TPA: hypothetical protein VFZ61_25615, partial [Polyangiales bacterium]
MRSTSTKSSLPCLPQDDSADGQRDREFQLSLARTAYNYVRSYPNLESVPLAASVPDAEAFTLDYNALVARSIAQLSENFLEALSGLLESALNADSPIHEAQVLLADYHKMKAQLKWDHWATDAEAIAAFLEQLTKGMSSLVTRMTNLPLDVTKIVGGLEAATAQALREGPTAFLKSLVFDMLALVNDGDSNPLTAKSSADFEPLISSLPQPAMLTIPQADWMPPKGPGQQNKPCQQDWFFGYLQVAGFNT